MLEVNNFNAVAIRLASPEQIRQSPNGQPLASSGTQGGEVDQPTVLPETEASELVGEG